MNDTLFFSGTVIASLVLAQVPEVTAYQDLTSTIILGALFGWTLTRLYPAFTKLTESINALKETIEQRIPLKED